MREALTRYGWVLVIGAIVGLYALNPDDSAGVIDFISNACLLTLAFAAIVWAARRRSTTKRH